MAQIGETLSDKQKYDFRRSLEEVRNLHGRGTELISLYIPPGKQISDVSNYLRGEYSQSSNIKSQSTRKNVQGAISSILARLKYFKEPPANGLIFFVGETSYVGDQTRMVQYTLEPPEPITTFLYRCDSEFFLDPVLTADRDLPDRQTRQTGSTGWYWHRFHQRDWLIPGAIW